MQQNLDRKRLVVDSLKMELQLKHERVIQVGSLLAKQECDEMVNSYLDAAEYDALEKHKNDYLKTRLQLEMIDCQIQLTTALLKKKDAESKIDAMKYGLDKGEYICQEPQEVHQKSKVATHMVQASDHSKALQVSNFGKKLNSSSTTLVSRLDYTRRPHESFNQEMNTTHTHYCNVLTTSSIRGCEDRSMQSRAGGTARKRTVCQCGNKLTLVKENKKND